MNIGHEAVDRHALGEKAKHLAMRFLGKNGGTIDYKYDRLGELTNKFANVLRNLGVEKGNRVFVLAGRIPELYITVLGTLKNRSIFCPLFSAFGPEPIKMRASIGEAKVLLTTRQLYQRKIAPVAAPRFLF